MAVARLASLSEYSSVIIVHINFPRATIIHLFVYVLSGLSFSFTLGNGSGMMKLYLHSVHVMCTRGGRRRVRRAR